MTAMIIKTASQKTADEVAAKLRARTGIVWIVTREEARVEKYVFEASASISYVARTWDVARGLREFTGAPAEIVEGSEDLGTALLAIEQRAAIGSRPGDRLPPAERGVWILRDAPTWLDGLPGATPRRILKNLARDLPDAPKDRAQAIVIVSPSSELPAELVGHATVIEWPMPDRSEIAAILDAAISNLPEAMQAAAAPNGTRNAAIDAAIGLTGEECAACYDHSLVRTRKIDPAAVAAEKKRVISRERIIEWFDPLPLGLAAVGGLENLKSWLLTRSAAYSPAARAYGLPTPKGILLVGVPGCGKSLTAKAIATAWQCPLLRVDLGAIKSKFVGESETNLRKVWDIIKTVGKCVCWFDEIEKALQGATSGSADGGVSADALGSILSWMQDRQGEAFVVMTANDVSALPPELLRKGRFDELFFVDLPTDLERFEVMVASLRTHGRGELKLDLEPVVEATSGFTGSEIAALVPDALFAAFADGAREIRAEDLVAAAGTVVPLSKTAEARISKMREWGKANARPASKIQPVTAAKAGRQLDL